MQHRTARGLLRPRRVNPRRGVWSDALLLATAMLVAGPAAAEFLDGSLELRIGAFPPVVVQSNPGVSVTVLDSGPVVNFGITGTRAFGPVSVDMPDSLFTGVPQISDLRISGLAMPRTGHPGTLSPGGLGTLQNPVGEPLLNRFGGQVPLSGSATICVFACWAIQIQIPLTIIGQGGTLTGTSLGLPQTVEAAPGWTTGPAQLTGINTGVLSYWGWPCAPVTCPHTTLLYGTELSHLLATVTGTGENTVSVGGAGSMSLVSPARITTAVGTLPVFARQTLTL